MYTRFEVLILKSNYYALHYQESSGGVIHKARPSFSTLQLCDEEAVKMARDRTTFVSATRITTFYSKHGIAEL